MLYQPLSLSIIPCHAVSHALFSSLETVPEEDSSSLALGRRLAPRRQSTSASSTTCSAHDGTRHPSPSPIGMTSLSHALPLARDTTVLQADALDNDDSALSHPRAQRRKYAAPAVTLGALPSLATAPTSIHAARTGSPPRQPLRNASQARLFGFAGHKRDECMEIDDAMEVARGEDGSKRPKPMA